MPDGTVDDQSPEPQTCHSEPCVWERWQRPIFLELEGHHFKELMRLLRLQAFFKGMAFSFTPNVTETYKRSGTFPLT